MLPRTPPLPGAATQGAPPDSAEPRAASVSLVHGAERAFVEFERGNHTALQDAASELLRTVLAEHGNAHDEEAFLDLLDALSLSDAARAGTLAVRWLEACRGTAHPDTLARATLAAVGEARRMALPDASVIHALENALAQGTVHAGLRVRLLSRIAAEYHACDERAPALLARQRAVAELDAAPPLDALRALSLRYTDVYEIVPAFQRNQIYQSCARDLSRALSPLLRLRGAVFHLDQTMAFGFVTRFDELVDSVEKTAWALGDHWNYHRIRQRRADRAMVAGDFARAQDIIRDGLKSPRVGPDQFGFEWWLAMNVLLSAERGDEALVPGTLVQLLRASRFAPARCIRAYFELRTGHRSIAQSLLEELLEHPSLLAYPYALANAALLVHVAFALGRPEGTLVLGPILEEASGGIVERNRAACHGPVDLYRGMLASLHGDLPMARTLFERALDVADVVGSPVWRARTLEAARTIDEAPPKNLASTSRANEDVPAKTQADHGRVSLTLLPSGATLTLQRGSDHVELALGERAAALLMLLADTSEDERSYLPDETVIARIWPRQAKTRVDLNVLIHRTRRVLERAKAPLTIRRQQTGTRLSLLPGYTLDIRS